MTLLSPIRRPSGSLRGRMDHAMAAIRGEGLRYRYLPEAMDVARLDPGKLRQLQIERLRALCAHAGRTVPYWRDLFASIGFDHRDISRIEDLSALPILTKDIIREQKDRMLSESADKDRLISRSTGGSTGDPLRFWIDRPSLERQFSINERGYRLLGLSPGDPVAKIWGYGRDFERTNLLTAAAIGRTYHDAFDTSARAMGKWLRTMRVSRPVAIYGYTSAVAQFARFVADRGARLKHLQIVCVTAEKLFPEVREDITRGLKAPVIDLYGCHEVVRLAHECAHGSMHIDSDGAVIERSRTDVIGSAGRILITSFFSEAMPFIRYDVGDYGALLPGTCPCGQPFPLMSVDLGKVHHVFAFSTGAKVHTTAFTKELYPIESLGAFQVVHESRDHVLLLAVPRSQQVQKAREQLGAAAEKIGQRLAGVKIEPRIVEDIPKTQRGKQPYVISKVAENLDN